MSGDGFFMGMAAWQIWLLSKTLVVLFAFIAIALVFLCLQKLDRLNGTNWAEDIGQQFETDAKAAAHYYGLRFAAVCISLAILLSR